MEILFEYGKCFFTKPNIDNIDDMLDMMNDEDISKMLSKNKRVISREKEIEWINKQQNSYNFSAYDKETLEYIGNCGFNEIDGNRGEIGIVIRKKMQGKHYAKDIINALIEYGRENLKLDEVYAVVFSDNIKSTNCITQLGFLEYHRDNNVTYRDGNQVDDVYYHKKI